MTRIRPVFVSALCFVMISGPTVFGQSNDSVEAPTTVPHSGPMIGGFAHLLLPDHSTSFARLPGVPNCCTEFTGGGGIGFDVGGLIQFGLSSRFAVEGQIGYAQVSALLREQEETTVIIAGRRTIGTIEHQIDAAIGSIDARGLLLWKEFAPLSIGVGFGARLPMGTTFSQREVLLQPASTGTFENNRRVRNEQSGPISDVSSLLLDIDVLIGYELPLRRDHRLVARPEIRFRRGISDLLQDSTWSIDDLAVGVAIFYGTEARRELAPLPLPPVDTIVAVDTVVSPIPIAANILVEGIDNEGVRTAVPTLRVEEFISTNLRPLLNYVFFAENSSAMPKRYVRLARSSTSGFQVDRLHGVPTLPTYHHLLNIVGKRMVRYPESTLRLVGTNDGEGEKEQGRMLSRRRAESVRQYLIDTWSIDSNRLKIEAADQPAQPSNPRLDAGDEENRRVELYSDVRAVLAPVTTLDTLRVTNPPGIVVALRDDATLPYDVRGVTARQGDRVVREFAEEISGTPVGSGSFVWNLAADQQHVPRAHEPLVFEYEVLDADGRTAIAVDSLIVDQITVREKRRERIADRYIDRFSLILFAFDRADVAGENDSIAAFIERRIDSTAAVTITGHTDWIGPTAHNSRLSFNRAQKTAERLGRPTKEAVGYGENEPLYDGTLPEGRFYSRTVRIVVETPIGPDDNVDRE